MKVRIQPNMSYGIVREVTTYKKMMLGNGVLMVMNSNLKWMSKH